MFCRLITPTTRPRLNKGTDKKASKRSSGSSLKSRKRGSKAASWAITTGFRCLATQPVIPCPSFSFNLPTASGWQFFEARNTNSSPSKRYTKHESHLTTAVAKSTTSFSMSSKSTSAAIRLTMPCRKTTSAPCRVSPLDGSARTSEGDPLRTEHPSEVFMLPTLATRWLKHNYPLVLKAMKKIDSTDQEETIC